MVLAELIRLRHGVPSNHANRGAGPWVTWKSGRGFRAGPPCCEVTDAQPNHRGSRAAVTDTEATDKLMVEDLHERRTAELEKG